MAVSVVFTSSGSVGSSVIAMTEAGGTHLLIVIYSILLEDVVERKDSVPVTGVESVSSKLLELSVSHLLGLLKLLWIELDLSGVDGR